MRYPGKTHQERWLQFILLFAALLLFSWSLVYVSQKDNNPSKAIVHSTVAPSPSLSTNPEENATLVFFDAITEEPLTNQSVAFLLINECASPPCPTPTPLVLTTNSYGEIVVSRETIRQKPKLYAAGYKIDRYFSFIDIDNPNELIVLHPLPSKKSTYLIDKEAAAIGLDPATP